MNEFILKISNLWPEMVLALGACVCLALGLARQNSVRRFCAWMAGASLIVAGILSYLQCISPMFAGPHSTVGFGITLTVFIKLAVCGVGLLLLLVAAAVPDQLPQVRHAERATGAKFDPSLIYRGEFFAFFLLSLAGVMLVAGADDLVWLFLALELTSLPTYVMVATSRNSLKAPEAAVKYFFLGALAAAIFLYGFALIYGATGATQFSAIHAYLQNPALPAGNARLLLVGLVLALTGISFKIAAVPMHFYTADVYQGAAAPISAFLAFVPKTAGFAALMLLLGLVDATGTGQYPLVITWLLWGIAVLTMTLGNVLGLLQTSVKRILAYSSIAHSGYMLVGLIAGTGATSGASALGQGYGAVLFYLVAYGLATLAAFAVLGCLRAQGEEADSLDDIAGLSRRHPGLALVLLMSLLSLIGLPPLVGFLGKIYLFGSAIKAGYLGLVIIAVLNSAISAVYYLRIAAACYFGQDRGETSAVDVPSRRWGATLAAILALGLGLAGGSLVNLAKQAADHRSSAPTQPTAPRLSAGVEAKSSSVR